RQHFGVILLDLGFPDSRDLDTMRRLRAKEPPTPVLILTGMEDRRKAAEALANGAQDSSSREKLTPGCWGAHPAPRQAAPSRVAASVSAACRKRNNLASPREQVPTAGIADFRSKTGEQEGFFP